MSDQKSQDGSENSQKKHTGGYMAIYHELEEISYGPLCGMPAIARVFLCIRHKLLRDGLGQKSIGHSFIMEKTGLTKSQVINSAKKLQSLGVINIVSDFQVRDFGRVQFFENKYELNPVIFTEELNWYQNNPTVRVYSKNENPGSYSRKGMAPSGIKSGTTPSTESDTTPSIRFDTTLVSDLIPGSGNSLAELLEKARSKNPSSKNPKEKNPSEEEKSGLSFSSKGKPGRVQCKDPQEEIQRQLLEAKRAGIL